ncbi:FG-GAP-like repeat-containing protein [Streptomyces sp. NPDC013457]|uniref:FG-GAP-like repeat-containing protein n=1 Tax=Streptomyces sp. NPDC013457 TaxID=3364866 RepID=UPI0036F4DDB0
MLPVRMPRRLGAAVATVLAVTLGAGLLTAAPAGATVSLPTAAAADPIEVRTLVPGAALLSASATGYITMVPSDDQFARTLRWTPYGTGASRDRAYSGLRGIVEASGDLMVVSPDGFGASATDMATGESFGPDEIPGTLDLEYKGTAGEAVFVTARDGLYLQTMGSGQRHVTGLPTGTSYEKVTPLDAGHGLLAYGTAEREQRRALVDLATASVTETFPYPEGARNRDVALSAGQFAWVEADTGADTLRVVVRDRTTGAESVVPVPDRTASYPLDIELLGDWLMFDGTARHLRSGETVQVLDHAFGTTATPDGSVKITQGRSGDVTGVFRLTLGADGRPVVRLLGRQWSDTSVMHDVNADGLPDVLARDAKGALWTDDLGKGSGPVRLGTGYQVYDKIEVVGNIVGWGVTADVIARDKDGVLWMPQLHGGGGVHGRQRVGGGWQTYATLTGGGDLNSDGRADVVAIDKAGVLWLYAGTGDANRPFEARTRIGSGWSIYDQLVAVGNLAGGPAGDLVARDRNGVLWLYLGRGDGTFVQRTKIGGGWQIYTQLLSAGDADHDGKADLFAVHPGSKSVYLYSGTGDRHRPFHSRKVTDVHAGATYNHMS